MKKATLVRAMLLLAMVMAPGGVMSVSALPGEAISPRIVATSAGSIVYAASCSQGDVQNAIDAASDGDSVMVPAGTCTWTTPPGNDEVPAVSIDGKGITLQGAGIGQTIITDATGTGWNNSLIRVDGVEGKPFRITGFTFTDGNGPVGIHIGGDCKNFRIDHCEFSSDEVFTAVNIRGFSYGVIDHCNFTNARVLVREAAAGDAPWKRPLTLGSANAVYVEDCYFYADIHANAIDSNSGGRWVFRYNTVVNDYCEAHGLQNANERGTFSYELYENTFTTVDNGRSNWVAFYTRGGTGVLFNNAIVNAAGDPYNDFAAVQDNRSCGLASTYWGPCDGTSPCDGNTPGMSGYPCRDQVGRSTDFSDTEVHPQALEPLYAWNNTFDGSPVAIESRDICDLSLEHVVEGRDFINGVRPGYTPYVYPHPLTWELNLIGVPGNQAAQLSWTVHAYLPPTTTWRIDYYTTTATAPLTATDPFSITRAYTLTGLTNYQWYTVTLSAMVDSTPILTDTVRVMPTDIFVYLPLAMKED